MKRTVPPLALAIAAVSLLAAPAAARQDPLAGLEARVEQARRDWGVPGLALAIVKDDRLVLARGFGVRRAGANDPVDEHTVFAIGSAGKAFTAAAVAMLVDDGAMAWDDRATDHLPGFRLFDPYVTRELTIRDLLAHRSGLERGEFIWLSSGFDRDEVLRRVRHLEPSFGFRSRFGYQNIMYLAAGQAVAAAAGRSWDEFVRERIFLPLGMTRSSTSVDSLRGLPNVAVPHVDVERRPRPIAYRNVDNAAPAGSVNASARDVAQWIRLHLGAGEHEGRRLLEERTVAALHAPNTLLAAGYSVGPYRPVFATYGLGWFVHEFRGRKVVQHGGNIDGMTALVAMLPDEALGLAVLTNMNGSALPYAIMLDVFDRFLGSSGEDWSARMLAQRDSARARADERAAEAEAARVQGTAPRLPLARYAGTYTDPMHGEAVVSLENGALVVRRNEHWIGDLEHWHHDTFRATWRSPGLNAIVGRMFVTFELDPNAAVTHMRIDNIGGFRREPDRTAARADS